MSSFGRGSKLVNLNRIPSESPIGTVQGGLFVSKEEGRIKNIVRRKGKSLFPIFEVSLNSIGSWALRVDKPDNGIA